MSFSSCNLASVDLQLKLFTNIEKAISRPERDFTNPV